MAEEAKVPPGLWARIQKMIDDSIAKFARSGFLRNASISGGAGLTIKDGGQFRAQYPDSLGGGDMLYVGRIVSAVDGSYQGTGLLLQAPDGTDLATFRTDATFGTTMANIYDSGGRIIFGNDAASGQGLARPYLPGAFYPVRFADMTVATTSGAFETLFAATIYKQHPYLVVGASLTMDTAGTTGEVRVLVNGVQLDTTRTATFAINGNAWVGAVAGAHMSNLTVEIQARRTSASGALKVLPGYCYGIQS